MRPLSLLSVLAACLLFAACAPAEDASPPGATSDGPRLAEGTWTGGLTPMNHPDMTTPLTYEVAYAGDSLRLALSGPEGAVMPARGVALRGDTLRFVFDEPDAGVRLDCALGRRPAGGFEGRCTDADGKWARFTMHPPAG